jgi:arabinose-5-phosphate isomerase
MVTMRASDLMRGLDRSALVAPESTIRETIIAMSSARCGSAMVVDDEKHLLGIFTDGDFRRMAEKYPNVLEMRVKEAMTVNPVTVNGDILAAQVLKLLEERHVDDLVVTDNNKCVLGFIDTQDLPGLKVM